MVSIARLGDKKRTMNELLLNFLPGIITAIVASYFAARWSLRELYSEKWWERKEKAYSEIIGSLYDVMQYCEYQRDHYEYGRQLSEEKDKELKERQRDAYWKLIKATDIGGFVISKEASKVPDDLRRSPKLEWNENPPDEVYNREYENHKQALERLIVIANKDLKPSKVSKPIIFRLKL